MWPTFHNQNDIGNRIESLNIEEKSVIKNMKNEFLYHILNWDAQWFYDKKYNRMLPNRINDINMVPTKLMYDSAEEYQNIMFPMLLHEFWYQLKQNYQEFLQTKGRTVIDASTLNEKSSRIELIDCNGYHQICSFYLQATIANASHNYPRRGDLIFLREANSNESSTVLAYVDDVATYCFAKRSIYKLITNTLIGDVVEFSNIITFSLTSATFLLGYLSLVAALESLPEFPLQKWILSPNSDLYTIPLDMEADSSCIATKQDLDAVQLKVMSGLLKVVEEDKPKICLVQGPPGTGKSKIIVNLVASILKLKCETKILVCAPSNKAIDSVVLQLMEVQSILREQKIPIRIVRIGDEDKMNATVAEISLTNQKYPTSNHFYDMRRLYETKTNILDNAHVIASTLTACYTSNVMSSIFRDKSPSTLRVCIVDEAAQASELLTMVPLLLGVKQLILVGDPQQLRPTVLSKKATDYGYNTSLFGRAQKIFKEQGTNPIALLDTQYRMFNTISQWPNSYFYDGVIKDSTTMNNLGITNYKLFNHQYSQDNEGHSNEMEAKLVVKLVKLLKSKLNLNSSDNKISIGIVTPYQKQRILLDKLVNPNKYIKKKEKPKLNKVYEKFLEESEENVDYNQKRLEKKLFMEKLELTQTRDSKVVIEDKHINADEICESNLKDNENSTDINLITEELRKKLVIDLEDKKSDKKNADEYKKDSQSNNKLETLEQTSDSKSIENSEENDNEEEKDIEVNTVDSFQGSERDIIIMSCVRSAGLGFTKDPHRLCVSLTRAKHSLFILGNFRAFRGDAMWSSLIYNATARHVFVNIDEWNAQSVLHQHVIVNNIEEMH